MMLVSKVELADLVTLGTRTEWPSEEHETIPVPGSPGEYVVVWRARDVGVPEALIVPIPLDDFYAWSTTYLAHLTPLSAIVRVSRHPFPPVKSSPSPQRGTIGLLFAEMAAEHAIEPNSDLPVLADSFSTLTSCLAQSSCLDNGPAVSEVAARWSEARLLLQLPRPRFAVDGVVEVWAAAHREQARSERPDGGDNLDLFAYSAEKASSTQSGPDYDFAQMVPHHMDLVGRLSEGPIEDRVRAFKEFVRRTAGRFYDESTCMALGGALSKVSGGTFRHARLLEPGEFADLRPLLWYGWFEALASARRNAPWFGEWLGLRLQVEMAQTRSCDHDVALEELRKLSGRSRGAIEQCTRRRGLVRVQLHEGVVAEFATAGSIQPTSRDRGLVRRARTGR